MTRFNQKNIVITGGTSGIGFATAQQVASEGANVLVTGRDPQRLARANEIQGITAVANDIETPGSAQQLREITDQHFAATGGQIDGLYLNAANAGFNSIQQVTEEEFERQFGTNVRGPLLQLAAIESALQDGSSVLFTTSVLNDSGMANTMLHAPTKGALRTAMQVAAAELGPKNIRVNAISPGTTTTEGFYALVGGEENAQPMIDQITPGITLGRLASPQEIAIPAAFLLSTDASFITGTELVVDGGMS